MSSLRNAPTPKSTLRARTPDTSPELLSRPASRSCTVSVCRTGCKRNVAPKHLRLALQSCLLAMSRGVSHGYVDFRSCPQDLLRRRVKSRLSASWPLDWLLPHPFRCRGHDREG